MKITFQPKTDIPTSEFLRADTKKWLSACLQGLACLLNIPEESCNKVELTTYPQKGSVQVKVQQTGIGNPRVVSKHFSCNTTIWQARFIMTHNITRFYLKPIKD